MTETFLCQMRSSLRKKKLDQSQTVTFSKGSLQVAWQNLTKKEHKKWVMFGQGKGSDFYLFTFLCI